MRPDGTVSLGFYGDLKVVGLTRNQVKARVIEHLREWLADETLGLVIEGKNGTTLRVSPERSTSVFVEEAGRVRNKGDEAADRIDALEHKLDRVLQELEALRKERSR